MRKHNIILIIYQVHLTQVHAVKRMIKLTKKKKKREKKSDLKILLHTLIFTMYYGVTLIYTASI